MNKFGLQSKAVSLIQEIINNALAKKLKFSVFVFGSRALGRQRKYSDLDLMIQADPELSETELAELIERFSESDLAIQIEILTERTALKDFIQRIESEKVFWFSGPK